MTPSRRLLLAFLLAIAPAGCGTRANSSHKSVAGTAAAVKGRKDIEPDYADNGYDYDDWTGLNAGVVAPAGQREAIVGVVTRYYSAVAMGNDVAACALLAQQPSELGGASLGGSSGLGPRACARLLRGLLKLEQGRFAGGARPMQILKVLIEGGGEAATVFLKRGDGQMASMQLQREGKGWKLITPRDQKMP